ncbi:glycosyl transferase, partial [Actinomadura sp. DSM 109109]|nr:glycosyl transferase [Actinomadura lepetitiana]
AWTGAWTGGPGGPGGPPPRQPGPAGRMPGRAAGPAAGGGPGGLLNAATPDAAVTAALNARAASYTWVAAAVGSNTAAGLQLATRKPVMAVGGFNGTDPAPTLAEF